jgi:hypothetical protein
MKWSRLLDRVSKCTPKSFTELALSLDTVCSDPLSKKWLKLKLLTPLKLQRLPQDVDIFIWILIEQHICRKTTLLSCHRCLINTGVEKIEQHLNIIDLNFDREMSLSKSKCWYSKNSLHFLKCAVPFLKIIPLARAVWQHNEHNPTQLYFTQHNNKSKTTLSIMAKCCYAQC